MYSKIFSKTKTPQNQPIPGEEKKMVKNSALGYSYKLDSFKRLKRFLILGSDSGSFYITPAQLTLENGKNIIKLIKSNDGKKVVEIATEISLSGAARKNEPAIFTLALALTYGDKDVKKLAVKNMPSVCRIGTHLFKMAEYIKDIRGWGSLVKEMFTNWYLSKPVDKLAYQAIKYQSRGGWSHRDLLRLNHIKPKSLDMDLLFNYIVKKEVNKDIDGEKIAIEQFETLKIVEGFERAKTVNTKKKVIKLITDYGLTREMIPTQFLKEAKVQEALSYKMGLTALIRSLGSFSSSGFLNSGNFKDVNRVVDKIVDQDLIKRSRVHPLQILDALYVYKRGAGVKGNLSWKVVEKIVDALDTAFYLSFNNVKPTGKNLFLALDVSGSMSWGSIAGSVLTPRDVSAALALITAKQERNYIIKGFSTKMIDLGISPNMRLDQVIKKISNLPFGGTDCALPMIEAKRMKNKEFDSFVIYTDSETWHGTIHPSQALKQYRKYANRASKLIVAGMIANKFTIADPDDPGMLDVIGFSTDTPNIISQFITDKF